MMRVHQNWSDIVTRTFGVLVWWLCVGLAAVKSASAVIEALQ